MSVKSTEYRALDELASRVQADLHVLRFPHDPWVLPKTHSSGEHVYDVAIIGGGQGGLAIAAGLMRERVDNIVVFDRQPKGLEGPWNNTARMRTLRTVKHLPGIDATLTSLAPQAWYTAKYGEEAWELLNKIPKEDWQEYLTWCRDTLKIPVENLTGVSKVIPEDKLFRLELTRFNEQGQAQAHDVVYARRVVVATGVDGSGAWHVPKFISSALPKDRYASSGEHIDFSKLEGKKIAVLGAGASAFDNASTALEAGALEATVCIRRKDIQRINPQIWMAKAGFLNHYADMDDCLKWKYMRHMFRYNIPAPQDAYNRLSGLEGAGVRTNAAWEGVKLVVDGGKEQVEVTLASGDKLKVDYLIVAVGFVNDFSLRPELSSIANDIALWEDKYNPTHGEEDAQISSHPYLGENFEFVEKRPGEAPYISRVFNFTYSALVSMGLSGSAISGFRYSVPRAVRGITKSLYLEDAEEIYNKFTDYAEFEMVGVVPFNNSTQISKAFAD